MSSAEARDRGVAIWAYVSGDYTAPPESGWDDAESKEQAIACVRYHAGKGGPQGEIIGYVAPAFWPRPWDYIDLDEMLEAASVSASDDGCFSDGELFTLAEERDRAESALADWLSEFVHVNHFTVELDKAEPVLA